MKRHYSRQVIVLLIALLSAMSSLAQYGHHDSRRYRDRYAGAARHGDVVSVRTRDAGSLESMIKDSDFKTVRLLRIDGPIDARDIRFIKKINDRSTVYDDAERRVDNFLDLDLEFARIVGGSAGGFFGTSTQSDVISDGLFQSFNHLRSIVLPDRVRRIGNNAFKYCYNLEEVMMPSTVHTIGNAAFSNCSHLVYVLMSDGCEIIGDECFKDCGKLADIGLPQYLRSIGKEAFAGTAISNIRLGDRLTDIGERAFVNTPVRSLYIPAAARIINDNLGPMSRLDEIVVDRDNRYYRSIDGALFDADVTRLLVYPANRQGTFAVPDGVQIIARGAFMSARRLTAVHLPESVTEIGGSAFDGCSSLTSLTFPEGVTTIAAGVCADCSSLASVEFLGDVTAIMGEAFSHTGLRSIAIPAGVRVIEQRAFESCGHLTHVDLPEDLTTIDEKAFHECKALTAISFPDGLATIGKEAFRTTGLTEVTLNAGLLTVAKEAFRDCKSLAVINTGHCTRLNTIGDNAFRDAPVVELTIPATVTVIGKKITEKCKNLRQINVLAVNPPALGKVSNEKVPVYVPAASVEAYKKADNWKKIKQILPLP